MQSFCGSLIRRQSIASLKSVRACLPGTGSIGYGFSSLSSDFFVLNGIQSSKNRIIGFTVPLAKFGSQISLNFPRWAALGSSFSHKNMTTVGISNESSLKDSSATITDVAPRIKFKRLDKTAGNIMRILDKEAVEEVKTQRDIPDIKPGYIVQLKVEVPENKRRVSIVKGVVIARRNAGLNTTFRLRRQVAGVGVESLFPLYSPNIKEIKVLDKKKVRRAKLYYLREKMNALKK